jgi:hypothetical protein
MLFIVNKLKKDKQKIISANTEKALGKSPTSIPV